LMKDSQGRRFVKEIVRVDGYDGRYQCETLYPQ